MQDNNSGARYAQLMTYVGRGWALTPLHDVHTGFCSCRLGSACRSAGKHPRAEEWQRPENLVRDPAGLAAALQRWPFANWGLATGLVSGVWVIDYDPASVDPMQAAEVDALLGRLMASARWMQRTGGGGLHFLFALPEDFVPNNGTGRLPKGFDVRGARRGEAGGGQIVIAPSVTAKGPYEVTFDAGAPGLAPPEVTEAVRPAPPRVAAPASTFVAASADQIGAYITAAINGELADLRATWHGRNHRAWRAAARCIEMINTGQVAGEPVYAAWWAAAAAHPDRSVTVPDVELLRVWASAERHVGDRPADLSSVGGPRGWMGGDAISFGSAPAVAQGPPVPMLGGGPSAGAGASGYPQDAYGAVDNSARGVTADANAQARGVTGGVTASQHDPLDPVEAMLAQLLDVEALRAIAPPQPLINGVLDLDTTAWIIGESGSYKSFVTLDFAAHVGLGRPWRGHDVRQGEVLYVVAEGARGMRLRVDAWEREYGPMKGVRFLPMPVQANSPQWPVLVEVCRRVAPVLVIIDTQARVTLGLDENSNSDMSTYAERVDEIKRATGACVLTVHHLGRNGTNARGASAIDGAQDAELRVRRQGEYAIELHFDKQKDQAEAAPIAMRLRRSEAGIDPATGRDLSSLVVDHLEAPMLGEPESVHDVSKRRALAMYREIAKATEHGGEGITRDMIRALFVVVPEIAELSPGGRRMAYARAWGYLLSRGRVMRYGTSQRFSVFPPPDGAADGLLTMNTGGTDDLPPDGWSVHWPEADRPQAVDKPVDNYDG